MWPASPAARRVLGELAALAWLAVLAAAFLAPALSHGASLGPYDVLRELGLTSQPDPHVHNPVGSDEIEQFIPWEALDWLQIHAGHLPLWNPYSLLGMPLAFNLESAPFSLSVAIGYLFPLHLAHTATVVARLLVGGGGAYVLGRTLRLGVLAALVGGSVFELSGAFTIWLGVYEADCLCFTGWVLAASVLVLEGRRRVASCCLLAISLAVALAAGEPQIGAILVAFLAGFALVTALGRGRRGDRARARGALVGHLLAALAAGGLVAPLYLPAVQLGLTSGRASGPPVSNLPLADLTHLAFADYNGMPTAVGQVIGPDNLYVTMVYVGVVALVLAAAAAPLARRRGEVAALLLLTGLLGVALFASPVVTAMARLPLLRVFRIDLATPLLDFSLAMLAAFGAHALSEADPGVRRAAGMAAGWATAGVAALLAALGGLLLAGGGDLSAAQRSLRGGSFLWPVVSLAACATVLSARLPARRGRHDGPGAWRLRALLAGRAGTAVLLAAESAFLVLAGESFVSSSPRFFPETPAIARLQSLVGDRLVGIGSCKENAFPEAGLLPDVNGVYGVDELVVYDPIVPDAYYASYGAATGGSRSALVPHVFCPEITSLRLARAYGVAYVLEPPGHGGPRGTRLVADLHGEGLYAVPGSGRATLVPAGGGRPVVEPASEPAPGSWRVVVDARRRSHLELRITDVPGWRASIDGRPLVLSSYRQVMLQAVVPPGRHLVTLTYWPLAFSIGLWLAAASGAGLLACGTAAAVGRRRRSRGVRLQPAATGGPPGPFRSGPVGRGASAGRGRRRG